MAAATRGSTPRRVVIVGAGLSGLTAARALASAGCDVMVLERASGPGGRMATRRIDGATFDHGAQFFTVRTDGFDSQVRQWMHRDLVHVWNHGFGDGDGYPRYAATAGMNTLAKDLAATSTVEYGTMAFRLFLDHHDTGSPVAVMSDDGVIRGCDHVVVSTPLPQAYSLVLSAELELTEHPFHDDYDRTVALLAVLDRPVAIGASGGRQHPDATFSFIGDNRSKGVSQVPALTFHAGPAWSDEHWALDRSAAADRLLEAARPWLSDAAVVEHQVKRWRFATPRRVWPEPSWSTADGRIIVCGDAFAGPRIEAAYLSGLAAAEQIVAASG